MNEPTAPLRVDFGGGWLDVPEFSRPGEFIVNCAISPLVSLDFWPYHKNAGLGGSAAFRLLNGFDSVEEELKAGVGWQDPAVINETGLCVWGSGYKPTLHHRTEGRMLRRLMALYWTGEPHDTVAIKRKERDYDLICDAGRACKDGVQEDDFRRLVCGIRLSYLAQTNEGMSPLPDFGQTAKKYCGSGWGGYALYLFGSPLDRDDLCRYCSDTIAIEPYDKTLA